MSDANKSNLSTGAKSFSESAPLKQHHRLACGDTVTGQTNPNGAESASTTKMVANNQGKTY